MISNGEYICLLTVYFRMCVLFDHRLASYYTIWQKFSKIKRNPILGAPVLEIYFTGVIIKNTFKYLKL